MPNGFENVFGTGLGSLAGKSKKKLDLFVWNTFGTRACRPVCHKARFLADIDIFPTEKSTNKLERFWPVWT